MTSLESGRLAGVLFDRDGTLIHDVPYNTDPALVVPVTGARAAVDRVRGWGVRVGVITNQSGVGRGLITPAQLAAVNARVEQLFGPFDAWFICPHAPGDGCRCRKPGPALVSAAAQQWNTDPGSLVVIGDIGADIDAAAAAGARGILVPNDATRPEEVRRVPEVAGDLQEAVVLLAGSVQQIRAEAAP